MPSKFSSPHHQARLASDGAAAAFTFPLRANLAHGSRDATGSAAAINGVGTEQQLLQWSLDGALEGAAGADSLLEELITREQERLKKLIHEINHSTDRVMLSSLLQNADRSWFNASGVVDLDGSLRPSLRLPTPNMESQRLQSLIFSRNLSRAMPSHSGGLGRDSVLADFRGSTIASSLVVPRTEIFHQTNVASLPQRTSASTSIVTLAASISQEGAFAANREADVSCHHQWHREVLPPLRLEGLSRSSTFDPAYLASVLLADGQPRPPKKYETGNAASTPLVTFAGCRQGKTSEGSSIRQPSVSRTIMHPGKAMTTSDEHRSPVYDCAFGQEKRKVSSLVATEMSVLKDTKRKSLLPGDTLGRQPPKPFPRTYRPPICLSIPTDAGTLSPYQCFLRQQIECFEATSDDVNAKAQGRNTPIVIGQIGIRCVHCAKMPFHERISGSSFYSQSLAGIYQIAQNMYKTHFLARCSEIPEPVRATLARLQQDLKRGSGGKSYWKSAGEQLGIFEEDGVLKFSPNIPTRDASGDVSKFVFN